jgi:histidinol-phosphate aminotransferase
MKSQDSTSRKRAAISRRTFMGAAAGSAALPLIGAGPAAGRPRGSGGLLRDYVGRLCYNENPLGPAPLAMTALQESAPMGHRYPDWFAESLRNELATLHEVERGQTIAGCGATEILRLAAYAFASPDGNVVCPYPSYSQFPSDASFLGATVKYADLDENHRVDLDAMAALVDDNTTAVCITNANNPTGTILSATAIADFVNALPEDVTVIIDEAYHEYIQDAGYASAVELVLQEKPVIILRTFSKVFGLAGVRVGYAVGHGPLINSMRAWHLFATVSRPSQAAAMAALTDDQHVADTVALNEQAKQYCFGEFTAMGLDYIASETNFFMVDVGDAATVAGKLAEAGIKVRTGWGMPAHLRVSTGTMEEMETFITTLQDILAFLADAGESPVLRVTALEGNFPNPFSGRTRIGFSLATSGRVTLQVFDIRGRLVKTLVDDRCQTGRYALHWDGTNTRGHRVAAGSYFYRLAAGNFEQTRRMILL